MILTRKLIELNPMTISAVEKILNVKLEKDPKGDLYRAESEKGEWRTVLCSFPKGGGEASIHLVYAGKKLMAREIEAAFGDHPRTPGNQILEGTKAWLGFLISGKEVRWILSSKDGYAEEMTIVSLSK